MHVIVIWAEVFPCIGGGFFAEKIDALAWALALVSALDHIHNALGTPLVHRGVCPAALFLDKNKVLKLGDFIHAVFIFDERKGRLRAGLGDPRYAAPETISTVRDVKEETIKNHIQMPLERRKPYPRYFPEAHSSPEHLV